MTTLSYITIAGFLLIMASVGFVFQKFNHNVSDYFRGGCKGTWWLVGMSAFMSSFSAWTFTGAAGVAFEAGWSVVAIFVGNAAGYLLNFLGPAAWFRQLRATTGPEVVRLRFNAATQQTYAGFHVLMGLLHNALHLFGLAIFCAAVFGFPMPLVIFVLGGTAVLYSVLAGAWGAMATDFLQGLILIPITIVVAWVSLDALGGISGMAEKITALNLTETFKPVKNVGEYAAAAFTWGWISAMIVKNMITWNTIGSAPRYFAVKDGWEARKAALLAFVMMASGSFIWFLPPMAGRLLFGDQIMATHLNKPAESAYAITCLNLLPAGLIGLVIVSMFCATLSSIDTNRHAAILIKDVYPLICRLFGWTPKDDVKLLGLSRWISLALGGFVILLALYFSRTGGEGIFEIMLNIGSYLATPMVIPMLIGLFVRRVPAWAALAAMGAGFACSLFLANGKLWGLVWNFQQIFFINAGVTLVTFLLSSLAWKTSSAAYRQQVQDFFRRMHTPIDFAREVGAPNDLTQLLIIGAFTGAIGFFVIAISFFDGDKAYLTFLVGATLVAIGALMAWAGLRQRAPKPRQ